MLAQQSSDWRPDIAADNKAATLKDTEDFLANTVSDSSSRSVSFSNDRCSMSIASTSITNPREVSKFLDKVDISHVDPLTIRISGGVNLVFSSTNNTIFGSKAQSDYFVASWGRHGFSPAEIEAMTAPCTKGKNYCDRSSSQDIRDYQIGFSSLDLAHRAARAFLHTALLCGGTRAVSPF
jgi:hypothetical protein